MFVNVISVSLRKMYWESIYTIIVDIDHYNEVVTSIQRFSAHWEQLAIQLQVNKPEVKKIRKDNDDCQSSMQALMDVWLTRAEGDEVYPTWRKLCDAVASVNRHAAEKIAKDNSNCSHCTKYK